MPSHNVIISNAVKRYGDFTAVDKISLTVKQGEFFTLLGPSGCGKTTLLRMIAGFNSVDEGAIHFADLLINNVPAHKRDIGMVFQNYAIFPHLTVWDNVAYGLKARRVNPQDIQRKVREALELVQIAPLAKRRPNELSGGQQQRVALARAFVIEPKVLLMDEPLSNLDAKLRVQMRGSLKKLQHRLGITTIYVTHDQEEALSISDRIAVMKDGRIMQVGTPSQIYMKPENPFVAGFIGISNFIECQIDAVDPREARLLLPDGDTIASVRLARPYQGGGMICVRPEQLIFSDNYGIQARIELATFLGDFVEYEVRLAGGQTLQVNEYTKDIADIRPADTPICVSLNPDRIIVYSEDAEVLTC
ncbi:MAG: ABC transporter ATP-binding protein [Clostridia bacterium]|nr:ABC transporter ATP-binding protein [Clostridia bacterium]